ncbi:MAG: hypothetical protein WCJ45_07530 [bacterium]
MLVETGKNQYNSLWVASPLKSFSGAEIVPSHVPPLALIAPIFEGISSVLFPVSSLESVKLPVQLNITPVVVAPSNIADPVAFLSPLNMALIIPTFTILLAVHVFQEVSVLLYSNVYVPGVQVSTYQLIEATNHEPS